MMSKERELLKRVWASERWDMPEDLQADIKELIDQPEQVPLSDAQIAELWNDSYSLFIEIKTKNFARAIEKAHGIGE